MASSVHAAAVKPVLSIEKLNVSFDSAGERIAILRDVSFDVAPRSTVAIVGESGSGKSVTALSVVRLLPANISQVQGKVELDGRSLLDLPEAAMRSVRGNEIAMIFQEPMTSLNPTMPVGVQIAETLMCHRKLDRRAAQREAIALLERVRIPSAAVRYHDYPHLMSGGMRQRVMIAMALPCQPKLLIADEPTTALDVTVQAQILDLLRDLQQEYGLSIVFITHDMGVVAEIADETMVMLRGQIIERGPTASIFRKPEHPYTRTLIAAVPQIGSMRSVHGPQRFPVLDRDSGKVLESGERPDTVKGGEAVLKVSNLSRYFDIRKGLLHRRIGRIHAVENVSFSIQPGETLALVGESGCGKSTTGRCIAGLSRPTAGTIELSRHSTLDSGENSGGEPWRPMQMVFQDPYASLDPRMRVKDSIAEPIIVHGKSDSKAISARVSKLLTDVDLSPEVGDRFPHEFSGGQRQRICIARALALSPNLVIADEAVSSLDVSIKAQVVNLMLNLQEKLGVAFLFISHDIAVVERISHRVAVMYMGEIVEIGDRASIFGKPQHSYTKTLLSAVPVADPDRKAKTVRTAYKELKSPIRPIDFQAPARHYREVSPSHQVLESESE